MQNKPIRMSDASKTQGNKDTQKLTEALCDQETIEQLSSAGEVAQKARQKNKRRHHEPQGEQSENASDQQAGSSESENMAENSE